ERLLLSSTGFHKSLVFPGLWLDPAAMIQGDMARVHQVLQQGLTSPEYLEPETKLSVSDSFGMESAGVGGRPGKGVFRMASPVLPDELWKRLEPSIPKPKENRHVQFAGRKPTEPRRVLTGILFVLRTGVPWRWLPATSDFPCGQTCRRRLRQWHKAGVWQGIFETLLAELQATHKIDWYRALVDSASVRAPCGGAKTGPNPTDRRKLGSKHHMLTDANGIPLAVILTEANRH